MSTPLYDNSHVPPVEGMLYLGSEDDTDVYFVPHPETGLHALTIVFGPEDWEWDSVLVCFAKRGGPRYTAGGPWAYGLEEVTRLGFYDGVSTLAGVLTAP